MGLLGTLVGGLKSFVTGGPVGLGSYALSKIGGAIGGATTPHIAPRANLPAVASVRTFAPSGGFDTSRLGPGAGLPSVPTPGFYHGTLSRFLPGGESGYSAAPPGYHINKRYLSFYRAQQMGHPVQDPTTANQVVNVVVRNRRMNPLNARALQRATARQRAFVRISRRALAGTGYRITRSGLGGKKGRRR